jgi:hypothetical protein
VEEASSLANAAVVVVVVVVVCDCVGEDSWVVVVVVVVCEYVYVYVYVYLVAMEIPLLPGSRRRMWQTTMHTLRNGLVLGLFLLHKN